jgi:hypothetical protein
MANTNKLGGSNIRVYFLKQDRREVHVSRKEHW